MKIGFVLLSNSRDPMPSTRITVLNMFASLRDAGFEPHVAFEPQQATEAPDLRHLERSLVDGGFRVVFFQKVHGESAEQLARALRTRGIRTVYGVCDLVDPRMVDATDLTLAVTQYLRSLYPRQLQAKIRVVHDGIENPGACKTSWSIATGSRRQPLRAVLVTSSTLTQLPVLRTPPPWLDVSIVGRYPPDADRLARLREARWLLRSQPAGDRLAYAAFLLDRRIHRLQWDPAGVYGHLRRADIGIIPIDTAAMETEVAAGAPSWKVKSENRLTMMMSVGLPVVATPIPAYEQVIRQGVNGFLAQTRQEWIDCLQALRDPQLRRRMGDEARRSVIERYSMNEQARLLVQSLRSLVPNEQLLRAVTH